MMTIKSILENKMNNLIEIELKKIFSKERLDSLEKRLVVYVAYRALSDKNVDLSSIDNFIRSVSLNSDVADLMKSLITKYWEKIADFVRLCSKEDLKQYLLSFNEMKDKKRENVLPQKLIELILELLNCKPRDRFACIGNGSSAFAIQAGNIIKGMNKFDIFDDESTVYKLSAIYSELVCINILDKGELFKIANFEEQYDKIFISCLEMNNFRDQYSSCIKEELAEGWWYGCKSAEWIPVIISLCKLLRRENHGKMISLVPLSMLEKRGDSDTRSFFLKSSYVDAVIALPENLLASSSVKVALVVYDKKSNGNVKFIDATDCYSSENSRVNYLTDENINEILKRYREKNDKTAIKTINEIVNYHFSLNPLFYTEKVDQIPYSVSFDEVVLSVKKKDVLGRGQLDKYLTNRKTQYRYVSVEDISDGMICGEPKYLKEDLMALTKMEECIIERESLIMSRSGTTLKYAVNKIESEKVVLSGNLFAISLNRKKIDPYFLQAFLDSEMGQRSLKRIVSKSVALSIINLSSLSHLHIPCPPLDQQKVIAEKYKRKLQELSDLKKEEENKRKELADVFDIK